MATITKNTLYTLLVLLGVAGGIALSIMIVFYMILFGSIAYYEQTWADIDTPSGTNSAYQESVNPQVTINAEELQRK